MADSKETPSVEAAEYLRRRRLVDVISAGGGADTSGEPIGLLLVLTKAS